MIKRLARVATTAFVGGALLFGGASAAMANPHTGDSARLRHDNHGDRVYPYYAGGLLHFTGFDHPLDVYYGFTPGQYGSYFGPGYVADITDDSYYVSYGFQCDGYRAGYYYGRDNQPYSYGGSPYFHRNSACDDFYYRHGFWYGVPVCDQYDHETGYCDR